MNKRYEPATFHIVKRENQPLTKQCYEWALFSNLESVKGAAENAMKELTEICSSIQSLKADLVSGAWSLLETASSFDEDIKNV